MSLPDGSIALLVVSERASVEIGALLDYSSRVWFVRDLCGGREREMYGSKPAPPKTASSEPASVYKPQRVTSLYLWEALVRV